MIRYLLLFILIWVSFTSLQAQVKITETQMVIPTYMVQDADPNPHFFRGERYQGASRVVYPYPMIDHFTDKVMDKSYTAIILENEYIEICVIPEFGGKLYYAKDKTNDYYFMYRNRVVKPALIGMTGAWISGGIEWNVPHHHRASTFSMVDYTIEDGTDGSKTIWVGETELRDNMKWTVGLTLFPQQAWVEATVKVMNTTPNKNTMLFWANASTHANEDYQIIFPPQTQYATYHKKNQFTEWPISRQIYTGGDFRKGVDISQWKNHSISSSFFAWESQSNFVAGYDHNKKAGTVIFGNPHTNPGAKLWSWGNNDFGLLWNDILTDNDGPYVELMFGAFSDNQPDYSWLHPYETKISKMYFMPSRDLPSVKKVNKNGILDLEIEGTKAQIGVYAARPLQDATIILTKGQNVLFTDQVNIGPHQAYHVSVTTQPPAEGQYALSLLSSNDDTLIRYTALPKQNKPMPPTVKAPKNPDAVGTVDSLFYVGMRLQQFHEPQIDPKEYYLRALELDPDHVKSNLHLGIHYYQRGMYDQAAPYIQKVVDRNTFDYTTAEDAEGLYYAGLIQLRKGNTAEAYKLLYKATWDYEWATPAHYQLSLIRLQSGDLEEALFHLNEILSPNQRNLDALSTQETVLRRMGKNEEALRVSHKILAIHPLNLRAHYEQSKLNGSTLSVHNVKDIAASGYQAYLEVATKYGTEAFYEEALEILNMCINAQDSALHSSPVLYYLSAYYQAQLGQEQGSKNNLAIALGLPVEGCFPYRYQTHKALKWALDMQEDAKTLLYLGNLIYDQQPEQAIKFWTAAEQKDNSLAMVNRNLAFAYAYARKDFNQAAIHIDLAIRKNSTDPLYFTEQDAYLAAIHAPIAQRLARLEAHKSVVLSSNPSASAYMKLLVLNGKYQSAMNLLNTYHFRTLEGDTKRAYEYWIYTHLAQAAAHMHQRNFEKAKQILDHSLSRPTNIDVPIHDLELIVHYFQGLIAAQSGDHQAAKKAFTHVTSGENKNQDIKLFAGLAYQQLGDKVKAKSIFEALTTRGQQLLIDMEEVDFFDPFSSSSPENLEKENQAKANYLIALGHVGTGEKAEAIAHARKAITLDNTLVALTFRLGLTDSIMDAYK
ncbi:MAG: DUF5107 domain-containing protein [Saprospiraceae bacterium]|nr:DUF5107 domain-containing protein [Saprospiraceae bacterium]